MPEVARHKCCKNLQLIPIGGVAASIISRGTADRFSSYVVK